MTRIKDRIATTQKKIEEAERLRLENIAQTLWPPLSPNEWFEIKKRQRGIKMTLKHLRRLKQLQEKSLDSTVRLLELRETVDERYDEYLDSLERRKKERQESIESAIRQIESRREKCNQQYRDNQQ